LHRRYLCIMKKSVLIAFMSLSTLGLYAQQPDTLKSVKASDVVVMTSDKETLSPSEQPASVSVITPYKINQRRIETIKDLSMVVPNVFIPEYGSRLTMPVYIRGVGSRSGNQSIGLYVDNVSLMDKSIFDFDFQDIQRIEVLRGPQGTLYGRNAMGGIINIYTLSPLEWQGTRVKLDAGNYGQYEALASTYHKIGEKVGISLAVNGNYNDGFFYNKTRDEMADKGWNASGRLKVEALLGEKWKMTVTGSYSHTDQNAFAYGLYNKETEEISDPMFNDQGSYKRKMSNNSLRFEYRTDKLLITSNTGYQWLLDRMDMDQDFTAKSIFTINQQQQENSVNQEFTIKNTDEGNYKWSAGLFGFYKGLNTSSLVTFKEDGIKDILQPIFDNMLPSYLPLKLTIADETIPNPGTYETPSFGFALYHQSTFKNLLTDGLSLTLGVRLDYEKQYLSYETDMAMNINASSTILPVSIPLTVEKNLKGDEQQDFLKFLPKLSIQYEFTPDIMTYLTVANGYKAGGYNIQMFSEVIQDSMKSYRPFDMGSASENEQKRELKNTVSYKPENTWNFELGTKFSVLDGRLSSQIALFYMDISNMQLTQFVDGGSGRILTNAGRARSFGAEISLNSRIARYLAIDLAYGYTNSKFTDYDTNDPESEYDPELNYEGNYVPYAPQHTLSIGAAYTFNIRDKWVDAIIVSSQLNGAGKIYWTERNDISQPFYCLLNADVTMRAKWLRISLWGKNLTNTSYGAFYFESFDRSYIQKGRPLTFGATVGFTF